MNVLLIHLAPAPHWLHLVDGIVTARGAGLPAPPLPGTIVIAAVAGEDVGLHWLDLPALAPAQARAAARMMAADLAAAPTDDMFVAVADGAGPRPVALVAHARMQDWLAQLAAAGFTARHIVPDMLLLPLPETGVSVSALPGRTLVRGADMAFAAEPALAELLMGDVPQHVVAPEDGLADALAALPLDLRQGDYALVQPWRPAPGLWKRMALLAAGAVALWAAGDVAALWQAGRAADAASQEMVRLAEAALPRGTPVTAETAAAQVAAEMTLRGAGGGMAALVAPLVDAVTAQPQAALASLDYAPATGLVAGLSASPAEREAVLAALGPMAAPAGERLQGDTPVTDIRILRQ